MTGNNAGQNGWQKAETKLSKTTVPQQFKFLWKISLGTPARASHIFSEPLLASRLINGQGFKDFVYVASSDTVYGVDSELGDLLWKKQYTLKASATGCGPSVGIVTEPPAVINFNARRAPGTPAPAQAAPLAAGARRLGVPAGGGGFGLKGIYALTSDGLLHEQVLTTGADFAPPVKVLPAAGSPTDLNIQGKTIYAASTRACGSVPTGAFAVDMTTTDYSVARFDSSKTAPLSITGPVVAQDGTAYLVTGPGKADATAHANSVVALAKDMSIKDWYTPATGTGSLGAVSPVLFQFKARQLLVAPGKDGAFVLLDAAALGGPDHQTPLSETPPSLETRRQAHLGWPRHVAGCRRRHLGLRVHLRGRFHPQPEGLHSSRRYRCLQGRRCRRQARLDAHLDFRGHAQPLPRAPCEWRPRHARRR